MKPVNVPKGWFWGLSQNRFCWAARLLAWYALVRNDLIMAKGFRPVDRDQPFLLPPDMREWLPAGHLAWFVIDAVGALDLSRFAARKTPARSAAGRAAYDPAMLLGLLVYGYATGVRSSRRIERACAEDVAFRVICAQDAPDHATIARFRREHFADPAAVGDLFGQVLAVAAAAGLGRLGLIAVDGTKIAAAASKDASRTEAGLRALARQVLAEAEAVDAAEDELFGQARGDELPGELADPVTRADRIRKALAELEAERQAAEAKREQQASAYLERHQAGRGGRAPREARVAAAQAKLDREIARYQAKTAASGLLRARARGPLHRKRATIGTALADAGYLSEHNLTTTGPDRLIATGKRRDLEAAAACATPAPPAGSRGGQAVAAMATRLATPQGRAAYRRRGPIAEGPFGDIKHNRGFRRFSLRGLQKVTSEWAFQNTVTNPLKIHATGWRPAPA